MRTPRLESRIAPPAILISLVRLLVGAGAAAALESDTVGSFSRGVSPRRSRGCPATQAD